MARVMVGPYLRHGIISNDIARKMVGRLPGEPNFDDFGKAIKQNGQLSLQGDMSLASELLTAQALSLDTMFTELTRRATMNLGDYPLAADRYARLAFKAQSNCRASLEALARLHQPREQTVRHVHVNEGGQAVVADHFHQHTGIRENGKSVKQSDATGPAGTAPRCLARTRSGTACQSPAVSGKRRCRMHGGTNPGAPRGNCNARKHGGYSAKTMAAARYLRTIARIIGRDD